MNCKYHYYHHFTGEQTEAGENKHFIPGYIAVNCKMGFKSRHSGSSVCVYDLALLPL
jgi:hypothetical protein